MTAEEAFIYGIKALENNPFKNDESEEVAEAIDFMQTAVKALEKSFVYRWHDLRKNPDDLPTDEDVMYECVLENHIYDASYPAFYFDTYRKSFGYQNNVYSIANGADDFVTLEELEYERVIAWREIEPFEEED